MLTALLLATAIEFVSPVNFPVTLAGNFGEPRPNHFHGGIDVRTEMAVGKPIFSVGEGYVSRITVGVGGFGNAVFVSHPNGTSSVYAHLKGFVPSLRQEISKFRQRHSQEDRIDEWHAPADVADLTFKPYQFPVSKGQLIAYSGNTGSSVAPHLHLEIHDTQSWDMLDPLDFLKDIMTDSTPPQAHAFMACPQTGEGVFCNSGLKQNYTFPSSHLDRIFTAWGKVGFALWADDYMEDTYHHYGVRRTELSVDGNVVFYSDVSRIPMVCNRMVNSWGDYLHFLHHHVWYMRSFIEPGNTLPVIHADANRGIVDFNEERDYHLVYTLTDVYGNQSQYSFVVRGQRQEIPAAPVKHAPYVLKWDCLNNFQMPGVQLLVRRGHLADNVELQPIVVFNPKGLSDCYRFTAVSTPLFNWAQISIYLKKKVADPSKLCIISGQRNIGGVYHDGWVTANIRELGAEYQIGYDVEKNNHNINSTPLFPRVE